MAVIDIGRHVQFLVALMMLSVVPAGPSGATPASEGQYDDEPLRKLRTTRYRLEQTVSDFIRNTTRFLAQRLLCE